MSSPGAARRRLRLADWPVARRLFAVIVAALLMGLVLGGLRVAAAEDSASQFGRTEQLARLSARLLPVIDDLQVERDATLVALISNDDAGLAKLQARTDRDLIPVRSALRPVVGGGFPASVTTAADTANTALSVSSISQLHRLFSTATPSGDVVSPDYGSVISDVITLQGQVALGVTDQSLTGDVQTLTALTQAKDLSSQQLALLDQSLSNTPDSANGGYGFLSLATESALQVAYAEELKQEAVFQASATPAEAGLYDRLLGPQATKLDGEDQSDNIEQALFSVAGGQAATQQMVTKDGISYPLFLREQPLDPAEAVPASARQDGIPTTAALKAAWDKGVAAKLGAMQTTEQFVAGNIVSRATVLLRAAQRTALVYLVITVAVLLLVLAAALLVARSLVLPLRELRAGALDVASVQLPERVRLLAADPESAADAAVAPIDVASADEIGQVARAFDQVHSEAVRLAGEQALLRTSFNATFVNLSRRSQTLIERLARMIDGLEQHEEDPERLGSLFSMDHLVTRMRRNSENLLLLAGHENPRKWSKAIPLADVVRAAIAEIEQYNRVVLNLPAGVSLAGQAVSDVVHLLAELIENATIFSSRDTEVRVDLREVVSGGVLVEITDQGIGASQVRLDEMNQRLDNPPDMDVSVSRHMGLFAVARLAERHGIRVRLRPASPQGISALVWLPGDLLKYSAPPPAGTAWPARPGTSAETGVAAGAVTGGAAFVEAGPPRLAELGASGLGRTGNAAPPAPSEGAPGRPDPLSARVPAPGRTASGWFRGGIPRAEPQPLPAPFARSAPGEDAAADDGAQTAAGLPVRVPRANLGPAARNSAPAPARPGGREAGFHPSQRSPDQARSRLAGFQRGTRRAGPPDVHGGPPRRAGEGTTS